MPSIEQSSQDNTFCLNQKVKFLKFIKLKLQINKMRSVRALGNQIYGTQNCKIQMNKKTIKLNLAVLITT